MAAKASLFTSDSLFAIIGGKEEQKRGGSLWKILKTQQASAIYAPAAVVQTAGNPLGFAAAEAL